MKATANSLSIVFFQQKMRVVPREREPLASERMDATMTDEQMDLIEENTANLICEQLESRYDVMKIGRRSYLECYGTDGAIASMVSRIRDGESSYIWQFEILLDFMVHPSMFFEDDEDRCEYDEDELARWFTNEMHFFVADFIFRNMAAKSDKTDRLSIITNNLACYKAAILVYSEIKIWRCLSIVLVSDDGKRIIDEELIGDPTLGGASASVHRLLAPDCEKENVNEVFFTPSDIKRWICYIQKK